MIEPRRPCATPTGETLAVAEEIITDLAGSLAEYLRSGMPHSSCRTKRYCRQLARSVERYTESIVYQSRFDVADVIGDERDISQRNKIGYVAAVAVWHASHTLGRIPLTERPQNEVEETLKRFTEDYTENLLDASSLIRMEVD